MTVKVSVVIPVFNEKDTVREIVKRVCDLPIEKEVLVVDDGSRDGSSEILQNEVSKLPDVRVIFQRPNQGKGAALRRGFQEATGGVVIVQDADLELDPQDILKVIAPVLNGNADVVYGSRLLAGWAEPASAAYWANRFLTALTNVLYGAVVTDMETCYKCCRREVLSRFRIESDRFDFEPEITAKLLRLGYTIQEVPVHYEPRGVAGGKKIGWRDGLKAITVLFRYRFTTLERITFGAARPAP